MKGSQTRLFIIHAYYCLESIYSTKLHASKARLLDHLHGSRQLFARNCDTNSISCDYLNQNWVHINTYCEAIALNVRGINYCSRLTIHAIQQVALRLLTRTPRSVEAACGQRNPCGLWNSGIFTVLRKAWQDWVHTEIRLRPAISRNRVWFPGKVTNSSQLCIVHIGPEAVAVCYVLTSVRPVPESKVTWSWKWPIASGQCLY